MDISTSHNETVSARLLSQRVLAFGRIAAARRDGRSVIYSVSFGAISSLMDFLKDHCCAEEQTPVVPLQSITRRKK